MTQNLVDILSLTAVPLFVALNAFFVAAEFALVTVRWTRVEQLVEERKFGAMAVREAVERVDDAIAATQLGITFASLALGWLGEPALAHMFEPLFRNWPWGVAFTHGAAVAVSFLLITYLHVVLGELAPKAIALQRAEQVALFVAGPVLTFDRVFRPFIRFMNGSGNFVVRLLHLPPIAADAAIHSVDEIQMLVEETEEAGILATDQATYVQNVFELSDKTVRDVMIPRDKVVSLSLRASEEEILEACRSTAHTRMPVWDQEPDNVVGIVNTKNLFHLFSLKGTVILMDAMYDPIFVQPDLPVARLLRIFKRVKRPMAIVQDDGHRFFGIVTLEDILEEIVGEIEDEHDVPPPRLAQSADAPAAALFGDGRRGAPGAAPTPRPEAPSRPAPPPPAASPPPAPPTPIRPPTPAAPPRERGIRE